MENSVESPRLEALQDVQSETTTDSHMWSKDVEDQLRAIEQNASSQSAISKNNYLELLHQQKFFKIPVIVLSGLNSIFAVGLNGYVNQDAVSVLNCILAFICATLGSVELFLGITSKLEKSFQSYQNFYLLSVKINNCIRLDRAHRNEMDGRAFLNECLTSYEQLFQTSNVCAVSYEDKLLTNQNVLTNRTHALSFNFDLPFKFYYYLLCLFNI